MILQYFTDNDLYKFTVILAIQRLYPWAWVRYEFTDHNETRFPENFARELRKEVDAMTRLAMTAEEKEYITHRCYFFDPAFIDFLEGYRYDPSEVTITQREGKLKVSIEGHWFRTVL